MPLLLDRTLPGALRRASPSTNIDCHGEGRSPQLLFTSGSGLPRFQAYGAWAAEHAQRNAHQLDQSMIQTDARNERLRMTPVRERDN